jgi:glycosyltransferase involved in cell wall biosynthesis
MLHIHLFFTKVKNESRLQKSAICLYSNYEKASSIVIALLSSKELKRLAKGSALSVIPGFLLSFSFLSLQPVYLRKLLSFVNIVYFFWRQIVCLIYYRPDIVSIHNPELLVFAPLLWVLKKLYGTKLIYEPHELEVCKTEVQNKPFRRFVIFSLEYILIPIFDITVLVSDSIADFYHDIYGTSKVFVMQNIPLRPPFPQLASAKKSFNNFSLKEHFSISDSVPVFIYQGLLSSSRGVRDIISVFSSQHSSALVLMGYGPMEQEILDATQKSSNIYFFPAVPPEAIISVTSSADFGVFFIPSSLNPSRSYKYSMPNKFFEYLMSGLPVVSSSNLVDVASITSEHSLGYLCFPDNISFSRLVSQISIEYPRSKDKYVSAVTRYSSALTYPHLYKKLMAKLFS